MKVNLIKIVLIAFGFTMIYALSRFDSGNINDYTDAIINVSNLTEENSHYIKKDLSKMRGVAFCDVSIKTNIISLSIDDSIISELNIKNILRKWGCLINHSSYMKITTITN